MTIDWSKAKEGYDFHIHIFGIGAFYRLEGDRYVQPGGGYIAIADLPNHTAIITERPKPWSGEGMPTAGTVCEVKGIPHGEWGKAIIMFSSDYVLVWDWFDQPAAQGRNTAYSHAVEIRPIRTLKRIAAEEREKAIFQMQNLIEESDKHGGFDQLGVLYDAGYRRIGK